MNSLRLANLNPNDELFNLVIRKGTFPYEYIDSFERLAEPILPPKDALYSTLTASGISDIEYLHAQTVWSKFGCKTIGEYSDIYLKTDVFLLADVFEQFRNVCLKAYTLDLLNI